MRKKRIGITAGLLAICMLCSCNQSMVSPAAPEEAQQEVSAEETFTPPKYQDNPYVELWGNEPRFTENDYTEQSFEQYGPLDSLGRCTTAFACLGKDLMPTQARGDIYFIKPTGWQSSMYDFVDGFSLYNRCHLIAFMLAGEDANERNLITGTRYMNTQGMLPFEEEVCNYINRTGNHVLYRVTPVFENENLIAGGVIMEAESVEDNGRGVRFAVYCFNVQPGVEINYKTGDNRENNEAHKDDITGTYVLNTNTMKFHLPECEGIKDISAQNRQDYTGSRQNLIRNGYKPCGACRP